MTSPPKAPPSAIEAFEHHVNPFGTHSDGIGPTEGMDVDADEKIPSAQDKGKPKP